jgi:hypothetical protein
VQARLSDIPMVGQVTTTARSLSLVRLTQEGQSLVLAEQLCALKFHSSSPDAVTRLSPDLPRYLPRQRRQAGLRWTRGRWELAAPRHARVFGARLDPAATAPLPTDAGDPRVEDLDRDGLPGLSVTIDGLVKGRIGLVQRAWTSLRGIVRSPDRVVGLIDGDREERILTVTNPLLRLPVPSQRHPDKARHHFTLQRVDAATTCPRLLAAADRLFK